MSDKADNNPKPSRKTFDRFDERGTHLAELLVFVNGPPLARDVLVSHGIEVTFVPKKRREAYWFANGICLLPELPQAGAWFAEVEVRSLGPEFSETYWTLRFAVAPDDSPPEDMREHAFRGAFPGNLPVLLQLGQIHGRQNLRMRAKYLTRRDRIPSTIEAIAPWLASPPPPGRVLPRETTWDVVGYPALTQVALRETDHDGAVWLRAQGELQTVMSAEGVDVLDAALWADLTTFMAASDRGITRTETLEQA